jgi:hypothetical protein
MALAMENIKPSAESEAEFEVEADGPTPSEDANVEGPDEDNLRH